VEGFDEGQTRLFRAETALVSMYFSMFHGKGGVTGVTWATRIVSSASEFLIFRTVRGFASELAFWLRAEGWGLTLPGAFGLLTERRAVRFWGSTGGAADGWAAHGFASRASVHLTHFFRASY